MKSTFAALILLLVLAIVPCSARADTDPLRAFSPESVAGAKKLATTITGTNWTYRLGAVTYRFRFGASGEIEGFKQWVDVHWRVVSPNEVLLNRPEGGSVVFVFNGDASAFECWDWHSHPATGARAGTKAAPEDAHRSDTDYFGTGNR